MDQIRTALEWPVAAAEAVPISLASGETAVPERGVVNRPWLTFVAIFAVVVFAVTLGFVAHHRSEKMRKAGTEPAATPGKQVVVPAPDLQP